LQAPADTGSGRGSKSFLDYIAKLEFDNECKNKRLKLVSKTSDQICDFSKKSQILVP
jgi:hypothetical protein